MKISLTGNDLVSICDLSKDQIKSVLKTSRKMKEQPMPDLLKGKIMASCFFEPSTRTRLSFEAAIMKLGGSSIGFSEPGTTSTAKGESLSDTIKTVGNYSDIIVIRHPKEDSAKLAADATQIPLINAGDGTNQHPTQTLIDLFTMQESQGRIDDLRIGIVGDLKYGRAIHSLCLGLSLFSVRLYFVAAKSLNLPDSITRDLAQKGMNISFHETIEEVIPKVDVLYMSRIQKERFEKYDETFEYGCKLKKSHLEQAKNNLRILHPLPRIDEIETSIDTTPFAYYFQQSANAVPVRMALLASILGKIDP